MNEKEDQMRESDSARLAPWQLMFVALKGKAVGPFCAAELSRMIADKRVTCDTLVWMPGMDDWRCIKLVPEVMGMVGVTPPPLH